jgi:GTPase
LQAPRERAALVGLALRRSKRADAEHSLEELAGLADAAGATVALTMVQERQTPDPATFIGSGKLDELARECARSAIDVVVFDNELSPAQLRQIEERVDRKVIDRTQLILDIFARRARTREGKWQVELAQLRYLLPRLVGSAAALSRLGGGIGTRGPGETKLETDRRRIRQRIHVISEEIDSIRQRRQHARVRRQKASVPLVALVGYTNAGKTTLFNLLTKETAEASNALFVTLDPLVRQISLPDKRKMLVSDTVGFIDRLPHTLVAAFRATLEQVAEADLVLHVIDAASPDRDAHIEAVERVLEEVGAAGVPKMEVFNKCDLIAPAEAERLKRTRQSSAGTLCISALKGKGRSEIIDRVAERLELDTQRVTLEFDSASAEDRERIARVYRHSRVVSHVTNGGRVAIEADVPRRELERVRTAGHR